MTDVRGLDPAASTGLFSANSDAIYQLDLDGRFTNGNEALCAITGYDLDELRRLNFRDVIHPDDLARIESHFLAALRGERRRYQTRVVGKDGRVFSTDVTKFPVHDRDGSVTTILGVARDLDPLREAVLENDRVTTLLRIASRLSRLAGWAVDVPTGAFSWSPELYTMLDADPSHGTPEELSERLVTADDRDRLLKAISDATISGEPFEQLLSARSLTGRDLVIQVVGEPVRDGDGAVTRILGGFVDITNAVAEQEEKLRSERRLRSTLDQMPDGVAFIGRDWHLTFLNRTAAKTSGVVVEEVESSTVWELFPEIEHNEVGDLYRSVMAGGEPRTIRSFSAHFQIWLEISVAPTDDGIAAVLRDVTGDEERRARIAASTRDLEAQAALIDATSDAMIVTGLDGRIEAWNAGAARLYGWSRAEAIGQAASELIGGVATDEMRREMRESDRWSGELHTHTRGGDVIVVETRLQKLRDSAGEPNRVLRIDVDITDQFAAREDARALEKRLQTTLDQISDGVLFVAHDWRITFVNQAGERLTQKSRADSLGGDLWTLFPGLSGSTFGEGYRRTMEERVVSTEQNYYPDLETWFEATSYPTDEGIMVYLKDIGEREASRREIEEQNRRLRVQARLLDAAQDAMFVRTLDHVVTYWNRAATELYGWTLPDVIGTSIFDLIYVDPNDYLVAHQHVIDDGSWSGELRQYREDGTPLTVSCRWQLILDDDGQPIGVFGVNSDVTEARREEEQRIRAQRMESLGTLAGGIAHDLNNVLTPILMSVQLLRNGEADPNRLGLLDTMDAGVKRGADMIRQVLSFARGIDGERAVLRVEDLVAEVVAFCRDTMPKSVLVEVGIAEPLWTVVGDRTQLMQVLINFVTNARDAMPDGGTLSIKARNILLTEEYHSMTSLAPPGRYVAIDVEDDGEGMSTETQSKIFEPFFTTKPHGEGTGLGLPTSMAIVRSHGGSIQVYSEPGNGTRFQLHVPAADEGAALEASPPSTVEIPHGTGERILIVDDEVAIRQIVQQTLAAHGYETLEASNGREAMDLIETGGARVDLVLTDMMMPVMDGAATARYLLEKHPGIAVVAASGLNANGGVQRVRELGVSHFIAKPFTTDALLRTLREALDER